MKSKEDRFAIGMIIVLIGMALFAISLVYCDKANAAEWCFAEPQAQDLCVFMEKCDSYKEQVQICLSANGELEQENMLLKQNYKLASDNLSIEQKINKTLKERIVLMDKQCDKRVEGAKPKFWYKLGLFAEGIITGGVIALIGLIAL